jgi:hypothetical protein
MTFILKKLTSFEFEKKEYIRGKHTRYDAQARLENPNKKTVEDPYQYPKDKTLKLKLLNHTLLYG